MRKTGEDDIIVEPADVGRTLGGRAGLALGGMVVGRLAGRAARPLARKLAARYGMPANTVVRVVDVTAPLLFTLAAETYHHRRSQPKPR